MSKETFDEVSWVIDKDSSYTDILKIVFDHPERDRIFKVKDPIEADAAASKFIKDCREKFNELGLEGEEKCEAMYMLGWYLRGFWAKFGEKRYGLHMWQHKLGDRFVIKNKDK